MAVTTDSPQPSEPVDLAAMVGLFYPADPERLADFVRYLLERKENHKYLTGCILPYGA